MDLRSKFSNKAPQSETTNHLSLFRRQFQFLATPTQHMTNPALVFRRQFQIVQSLPFFN